MNDYFAKYRRSVTQDEAQITFLALQSHRHYGLPLDPKIVAILMALVLDVADPIKGHEESER